MTRGAALVACLLLAVAAPAGTVAAANETATLVYEGDELTLHPATGQVVSGETTLPAGSSVTVRIRSTGNGTAFLRTAETVVGEYGTFEAYFDMSRGPAEGTFEVSVRHGSEELDSAAGEIVPCDGECPSSTPTERDAFDSETRLASDRVDLEEATTVTRSRTARIPVSFGDRETVTLVVGDREHGYRYVAPVRDADGDGRAVVLFRTESAGLEGPTAVVLDDGTRRTLDPIEETDLSSLIDVGDYPVAAYAGENASEEPADVGSLVIQQAPPESETPTRTVTEAAGTRASTPTESSATERPADGSFEDAPIGIGAVVVGCALAVVGVGALLGLFRS